MFREMMQTGRKRLVVRGSSSCVVDNELKALKIILKVCNKEVFGNVMDRKIEILAKVGKWDARGEKLS